MYPTECIPLSTQRLAEPVPITSAYRQPKGVALRFPEGHPFIQLPRPSPRTRRHGRVLPDRPRSCSIAAGTGNSPVPTLFRGNGGRSATMTFFGEARKRWPNPVNVPWDYQTPCPTSRPHATLWRDTSVERVRRELHEVRPRMRSVATKWLRSASQSVRSVPRPARAPPGGCSQRGGAARFRASSHIPSAPARPLPADQFPAGIPVNMGGREPG